jgi:hypothetical protein
MLTQRFGFHNPAEDTPWAHPDCAYPRELGHPGTPAIPINGRRTGPCSARAVSSIWGTCCYSCEVHPLDGAGEMAATKSKQPLFSEGGAPRQTHARLRRNDTQRPAGPAPTPCKRCRTFEPLGEGEQHDGEHRQDMSLSNEQWQQHQRPACANARGSVREPEIECVAIRRCTERGKLRPAMASVQTPLLGGKRCFQAAAFSAAGT